MKEFIPFGLFFISFACFLVGKDTETFLKLVLNTVLYMINLYAIAMICAIAWRYKI